MAIRTKDEILAAVRDYIGEDPGELGLTLLEDVSDSFADQSASDLDWDSDTNPWKTKYIELDATWRKRYANRFIVSGNDAAIVQTEDVISPSSPAGDAVPANLISFDDLFKEV